jgi:putative ABC transport system ATP-binding protein
MNVYDVRGISHRYKVNGHFAQALSAVDLEVRKGEFIAIAGPSGSGKTTLLNILGLLDAPSEGRLQFDGAEISNLSERQKTRLRRERIGYIFQTFNLIPVLSAYENVEYGILKNVASGSEARRRVLDALAAVGISAQADQRPNSMSGGQRQRVAIARALVREPGVVLADEPTACLDQSSGMAVIDLMKRLNRERGVTFIFSSHDPKVLTLADRVVQLVDGRIIA